MTIRYNAEVATATFSGFHKLLLRYVDGHNRPIIQCQCQSWNI